jgi:hypothetical protein
MRSEGMLCHPLFPGSAPLLSPQRLKPGLVPAFACLASKAPFQGDGDQQAFDAGRSDHLSQMTYVAFWHIADARQTRWCLR